jgi:hypothetical protein
LFVCNHGAVPRIEGGLLEQWTISVEVLVERQASFSLNDLKNHFPVVTLPVTLVCAVTDGRNKTSSGKVSGLITAPLAVRGSYVYDLRANMYCDKSRLLFSQVFTLQTSSITSGPSAPKQSMLYSKVLMLSQTDHMVLPND